MKVLVTGATGFLGSHVAEELLRRGHEVRALVRASSDTRHLDALGVEKALGAMDADAQGLKDALSGVDAVVHSAGLVKARTPEEFDKVNAEGTRRLLDAVQEVTPELQRFVFVSSLTAQGASADGSPVSADDEPRPVTHYGRSKLKAEGYVQERAAELPCTIIRPPAIYGPRDREMLAFFKMVKQRVVLLLGRGHTASMIYGPDCARLLAEAVEADTPSGKRYFVDDGHTYGWEEMVAILERVLGVKTVTFPAPKALQSVVASASEAYGKARGQAVMLTRDKLNELREKHWVCSGDEARADFAWAPEFDFEKGAEQTASWYRAQGWL